MFAYKKKTFKKWAFEHSENTKKQHFHIIIATHIEHIFVSWVVVDQLNVINLFNELNLFPG